MYILFAVIQDRIVEVILIYILYVSMQCITIQRLLFFRLNNMCGTRISTVTKRLPYFKDLYQNK